VQARRAQTLLGTRALLRGCKRPTWHWRWPPCRCSRWCRGRRGDAPHRPVLEFVALREFLCRVRRACRFLTDSTRRIAEVWKGAQDDGEDVSVAAATLAAPAKGA
jgi:hypothetical protein